MRTKYKNGSRSIASTSTPLRFGLVPTSSFGWRSVGPMSSPYIRSSVGGPTLASFVGSLVVRILIILHQHFVISQICRSANIPLMIKWDHQTVRRSVSDWGYHCCSWGTRPWCFTHARDQWMVPGWKKKKEIFIYWLND